MRSPTPPPPRASKRGREEGKGACRGNAYEVDVGALDGTETPADHIARLTLHPISTYQIGAAGATSTPITMGRVVESRLRVPRYYGRCAFGPPAEGSRLPWRSSRDTEAMRFAGTLLRERRQDEAVDAVMTAFDDPERNGCVICLPCGFGKTVVALNVASRVARKTLVLVHTDCLFRQWQERIAQYLPDAVVGRIRGPVCEVDGAHVVVGMLQSVQSGGEKYSRDALEQFDLVVVDEAHHICARTFAAALRQVPSPLVLGLSATPERKDGLTPILFWMIGPMAFSVQRRDTAGARVLCRHPPRDPNLDAVYLRNGTMKGRDGKPMLNMARMVNDLCEDTERIACVCSDIHSLIRLQRHVIVLSDRVAHLKRLCSGVLAALKDSTDVASQQFWRDQTCDARRPESFMLVAATKRSERAAVLSQPLIFTTFTFAAEGLDVPRLDAAVLASPKSSVEQAIGRVMRDHPDKPAPIVLDYVDNYSVFNGMFQTRSRTYKRLGVAKHHIAQEESLESVVPQ